MTARPPVPWAQLIANTVTVGRYRSKIYASITGCHYWTGAISDSGHAKFRTAGSRKSGNSRVVTGHVFGWALEYGPESLADGRVVRHGCDETSCQNPEHWKRGERAQNHEDYLARRGRAGHALSDVRGPHGRAVAIRQAILTAEPGRIEEAIAAAIAAGNPSGAQQEALW
ncbi:hypothetical protein [Streptacidiphilus sp. MAP5-52]|uniref:hypothetical protein n=1 Tax=Streptacidiphilus sp. MAP5-52 TaxID=3156267 RepID=UPI003513B84B